MEQLRASAQGQGADRPRIRPSARGPRALHLPAPRSRRRPDPRADQQRHLVGRLRNRRDLEPRAPPARADERDRGAARRTGGRVLPGEAGGWAGPPPGRRPGRRTRPGGGHRRRHGRLQRRGDRARARRERHDRRALDRPNAPPGGGARLARHAPHVFEPADRGVGRRRGRRHRRRAHPRRARAEARHARDGRGHEGGVGHRGRRDRPGWLLRDRPAHDPLGARVRRRRGHALLRREHARRGSDHVDQGADECDAAVRRGDRRPRARGGGRTRPGARTRRERARRQGHVRGRGGGAQPRLRAARGRAPAVAGLTGYDSCACAFFCADEGKSRTTSQVTPAAREVTATQKTMRPISPRTVPMTNLE